MQIDLNLDVAFKDMPPKATDLAVALIARSTLLELIAKVQLSEELKAELSGCATRISDFIAKTSAP